MWVAPLTITLLTSLALAAYLTAAAGLASARPRWQAWAMALAALAILAHGTALVIRHNGVDLHFFAAMSLVGLTIATITWLVNLVRPVAGLGVIVFPLAALAIAANALVSTPTTAQPLSWQIKLHVSIALLSYSVLSTSALLAVLLALQQRALRSHRLDAAIITALPPLTLTETLMFRMIAAGFALLTLTLVTGALFVDNLFAQHLVHKTVLSIAAWFVFGTLLLGRWHWGWRGRRAVDLTLAGMVILLLAFFGSKFVLELVLRRGG